MYSLYSALYIDCGMDGAACRPAPCLAPPQNYFFHVSALRIAWVGIIGIDRRLFRSEFVELLEPDAAERLQHNNG